jgi:hypothetical protein
MMLIMEKLFFMIKIAMLNRHSWGKMNGNHKKLIY